MQYVITKYHGCTATKPASVTAKQSGGPRIVREYVGAIDDVDSAELRAVNRLRKRLTWAEPLYRAGQHTRGAVWCFSPLYQAIRLKNTTGEGCVPWANDDVTPLGRS